jgi:hypothetical protein
MTALTHTSPLVQIRAAVRSTAVPTARRPRLCPTGDGWSLLSADGELLVHGLGTAGRRECLQAARRMGVLVLAS